MDIMSKEKIIKALKITTTVILPLTITLASILFWAKVVYDPEWLILYPKHAITACFEGAGLSGSLIYYDIRDDKHTGH